MIQELGVAAAFRWFEGELGAGAIVEHVVLRHAPGRTMSEMLLDHADGTPANMIALGGMRLGRVERWVLGRVTTDVARDGRHSLLVVPPAATTTTDAR